MNIAGPRRERSFAEPATWNSGDGSLKLFIRGRAVNMYAPSSIASDYNISRPGKLPSEQLQLEWVYGYRGHDCRSNVYYLPTGELVYFVAAVVVLYDPEDSQQRHYLGHDDDVKCIAVHPDRVRVATGQVAGNERKDGRVHEKRAARVLIWSSKNLETLQIVGENDFQGAVYCLAFSIADGGHHLVAVDKSKIIYVWNVNKDKPKKITETRSSTEPDVTVEFHPTDNNRIVSCGKGQITFWQFDGTSLSKKQGVFGKHERPRSTHCIAFSPSGDVLSGDSNGNIFVWGRGTSINKAILGAHPGGVFALCFTEEGNLLSGGKDRKVAEWNQSYERTGQEIKLSKADGYVRTLSTGKKRREMVIVGTKNNSILWGSMDRQLFPVMQGHRTVKDSELWGLAPHPSKQQFMTCGWDEYVYLWDSHSKSAVWSTKLDHAAHSCSIHPDGNVAAVGTRTPRWVVLDMNTSEVVSENTIGTEQIECIRYSPNGRYLAAGSRDNNIYVYKVKDGGRSYSKVGQCSGHSSYVTHIDWSDDSQYLASNSGDYELLFWSASTCEHVTSGSSLRDVRWATQTCTWGFNVAGIWPEGADGTDINCCDRSNNDKLVVDGDDNGKVNLFRYPCCQPRSPSHTYTGHSSHVTNASFLFDDSRVVTTGGWDLSVLQWKVV